MLYLTTSNQLEQLSLQFANILREPLSDVFTPEKVVVQNAGMARYLAMKLADTHGISANTEYLFPAEFMWQLLRLVSPDIPEANQSSPDVVRFYIMDELCKHAHDYPELAHYIIKQDTVNTEACWQLANQLAQLLDQYLFYRSDWIRAWEAAPESLRQDDWQARLWHRCVTQNQITHWLTLQDQFKQSLSGFDKSKLPERISFFSMSALSPGYLDLLGVLGQYTDVHFYLINPCKSLYWGELSSPKAQAKLPLEAQSYSETGHPLLASLGKQGRDFIHQLLDLPHQSASSFTQPLTDSADSILHHLQQDILTLSSPTTIPDFNLEQDNSIRFNACHTVMREVEVLYDQLLDAFESDPSLAPADIVVMMPDVEKYAPYIDAVFSQPPSGTQAKIPYSIADRDPSAVDATIDTFLKVLNLLNTRFDVESVFDCLNHEAIREQFDLDDEQLDYCRQLAKASNIRWGIDAQERARLQLPNTAEHTWKYALDRILLGFTLGDCLITNADNELQKQVRLFESPENNAFHPMPLLPFTEIEGNNANTLANFKQFTDTLFAIQAWQEETHTLAEWITRYKQLLTRLFGQQSTSKSNLTPLLSAFDSLLKNAQLADFTQKIPFSVSHAMIEESLQSISGNEKYLGHGITFCALVPMRSVPFKLVALMGMNDGDYPRQDKRPSYNRLAQQARRGDRSRRDEDRYLFLESILAARERLLISFIGQNSQDNSDLPPAIVVSELLDTLTSATGTDVAQWICKHPLQAFSPRYFNQEENLFSYAAEYTDVHQASATQQTQHFISEKLTELDDSYRQISLSTLIRFFQNPAREFLQQRFALSLFDEDRTLATREPFTIEAFQDQKIRNTIVAASQDDALVVSRAQGLLPYGDIGDSLFYQEKQIVDEYINNLPDIDYQPDLEVVLNFGDLQLDTRLSHLTATGRVIQQLGNPFYKTYIDVWLNHLVLNTQNLPEAQKYTTFYSPETSFKLSPVQNASQHLEELMHAYWEGMHYPALFFPKAAFNAFKTGEIKPYEALKAWQGNQRYSGEKDKFENWLLYRTLELNAADLPDEFIAQGKRIYGDLFKHLELL